MAVHGETKLNTTSDLAPYMHNDTIGENRRQTMFITTSLKLRNTSRIMNKHQNKVHPVADGHITNVLTQLCVLSTTPPASTNNQPPRVHDPRGSCSLHLHGQLCFHKVHTLYRQTSTALLTATLQRPIRRILSTTSPTLCPRLSFPNTIIDNNGSCTTPREYFAHTGNLLHCNIPHTHIPCVNTPTCMCYNICI